MSETGLSVRIDPHFLELAFKGKIPCAKDQPAPWTYRGWLLWYVQQLHGLSGKSISHEGMSPIWPDRWGYLSDIAITGRLPDRPIPQIAFHRYAPAKQMLAKCVSQIEGMYGYSGAFREFVDWLAYGMGLTDIKSHLDDRAQGTLYQIFDASKMLYGPYDYLGDMLAERKGRDNPTAFFPTPLEVADCMARLVGFDEGKDKDMRMSSFNDPCMGTGRMGLCASNHTLNLTGQDIDPFVLLIAGINGCLYAPWLVVPVESFLKKAA